MCVTGEYWGVYVPLVHLFMYGSIFAMPSRVRCERVGRDCLAGRSPTREYRCTRFRAEAVMPNKSVRNFSYSKLGFRRMDVAPVMQPDVRSGGAGAFHRHKG